MKKTKDKIKEIRSITGLSQVNFSKTYNIPISTIEAWERGTRTPPGYVIELLEYRVKNERGHGDYGTRED